MFQLSHLYVTTGKAMKVKVTQSHLTLCDPLDLSMKFSRPEYWSG